MADGENKNVQSMMNLFEGIDTIIHSRINDLAFDKTVTCDIIDITNRDKGEYIVDDGTTTFKAFSENTSYSKGTSVYVSIPNGDYKNQKVIVGKYIKDTGKTTPYNYISPWDNYVDITENLLLSNIDRTEFSLLANGNTSEVLVWEDYNLSLIGYDRLGLRSEFKTWLQALKATSGTYGLRLDIIAKKSNSESVADYTSYSFDLDSDEMFGNVYNYETYYTQEAVFDISGITTEIVAMRLVFYQRQDFKDQNNVAIPHTEADGITNLPDNILLQNPYLSVGYALSNYTDDTILLYTLDPDTYVKSLIQTSSHNRYVEALTEAIESLTKKDKNYLKYIRFFISEVSDEDKAKKYGLTSAQINSLSTASGTNFNNALNAIISYYSLALERARTQTSEIDATVSTDSTIQAVLVKYKNLRNIKMRWIHVKGDGNLKVISSAEDEPESAHVHWYRYKLEQQDEILEPMAGAFWTEYNKSATRDGADLFEWADFSPDINEDFERIKVIIENPSSRYLAKQKDADDDLYFLSPYYYDEIQPDKKLLLYYRAEIQPLVTTAYEEFKSSTGGLEYRTILPYYNNTKEYDEDLITFLDEHQYKLIVNRQEFTISDGLKQMVSDKYSDLMTTYAQVQTIESEIITFNNENPTNGNATIDLISSLEIKCDTIGYNGVYKIYSEDGSIMSRSESTKKRILTASYTSLITGVESLDTAEQITWYIPKNNTMIYPPTEGVEYSLYDSKRVETQEDFDRIDYYNYNSATKTYTKAANFTKNATYYYRNSTFVDTTDPDFYKITRMGVVSSTVAGDEEADTTDQYFRIKDYYTESAINNTVYCEIVKNNKTYPRAEYEIVFGPAGTNGTDYTFVLDIENKKPALTYSEKDELIIIPKIYDYKNNDITDKLKLSDLSYSWYSSGAVNNTSNKPALTISPNSSTDGSCKVSFTSGYSALGDGYAPIEDCQYYILQATWKNGATLIEKQKTVSNTTSQNSAGETEITNEIKEDVVTSTKNVTLTAYFPIVIRNVPDWITFDGVSKIVYSTSGVNPSYYKGEHKLYQYDTEHGQTVEKTGISWEMSFGSDTSGNTEGGKTYYPQLDTKYVLTAPSLYMQDNGRKIAVNAYDNTNHTLLWSQPIRIYQAAYSSSMLNSWDGSLTIDENNGTILSAMIGAGIKDDDNRFSGVLMGDVSKVGENIKNLTGINKYYNGIGLYGYNEGIKSFGFNINGYAFLGKAGHGQILFDGNSGIIQSANFLLNNRGMSIDVDKGILKAFGPKGYYGANKETQSSVLIDPYTPSTVVTTNTEGVTVVSQNKPYFEVKSNLGNVLFTTGTKDYYLRSDNYTDGKMGGNLDLNNGVLKMFDKNGTGSYVEMSGNGSASNPYFSIYSASADKTSESSGRMFCASENNFFMRSINYNTTAATGLYFDLKGGKLNAYSFTLKAYQSGNSGNYVLIDSSSSQTHPLQVVSADGKTDFKVSWSGAVTANDLTATAGGKIGPFTISSTALYTGGSNRGGTGVYLGSDGLSVSSGNFEVDGSGNVIVKGNLKVSGQISGANWGVDSGTAVDGGGSGTGFTNGPSGTTARFGNVNATGGTVGSWIIEPVSSSGTTNSGGRLYDNAGESMAICLDPINKTISFPKGSGKIWWGGESSAYISAFSKPDGGYQDGSLYLHGGNYISLNAASKSFSTLNDKVATFYGPKTFIGGGAGDWDTPEVVSTYTYVQGSEHAGLSSPEGSVTVSASKNLYLSGETCDFYVLDDLKLAIRGGPGAKTALTGTATFADGSKLTFFHGMLVGIQIATS